jgi:preprotein translocase subunit SecF
MQFFKKTNINFIGARFQFFIFSLVFIVGGLIATSILGIEYGIDFVGGTEVGVKFEKEVNTDLIRDAMTKAGFTGSEIKSFGEEGQHLIRLKQTGKIAEQIVDALQKAFPDNKITLLKSDTIGPKIGSELRTQAIIAILLAIIGILIYIAFRFEFVFGLGAIVALIHDVLFTLGIVVVFHHLGIIDLEMNLSLLAAFLTVIGYSVNDTVIIFDRIRENREKHKGMNFIKMVNLSINETLSRTVNTVLTVVLVLITLVLVAGPVLQGFAFTMLVGILVGTYSSIYIASSFVIWFLEKVKKVKFDEETSKKTAVSAAL